MFMTDAAADLVLYEIALFLDVSFLGVGEWSRKSVRAAFEDVHDIFADAMLCFAKIQAIHAWQVADVERYATTQCGATRMGTAR